MSQALLGVTLRCDGGTENGLSTAHIKVLGERACSGTSHFPVHGFIKGHKSVILCKFLGHLIRFSTHPGHLASMFVMMGAASHVILTAQSVNYDSCCTEVQSLTLCKMYSIYVHINAVDGLRFHIFSFVM